MCDLLHFDGERRAKRIKVTSSAELHPNRESFVCSQQQARHPPPPTLHQQEQQTPPASCPDQLQQGQQPLPRPLSKNFLSHPAEHAAAVSCIRTSLSNPYPGVMDDFLENIPWPNGTFDPSWKWPASASSLSHLASHSYLAAPEASLETGDVFPPMQQMSTTPGDFESLATTIGTPLRK
jgi:hypothetical protein